MSRVIASPSIRYGGDSTARPSTSRYHATAASTSATCSAVCASPVITRTFVSIPRTQLRVVGAVPAREHALAQVVAAVAQRSVVVADRVDDAARGFGGGRVRSPDALAAFPHPLRQLAVLARARSRPAGRSDAASMSVSIGPGMISITRIPNCATSAAATRRSRSPPPSTRGTYRGTAPARASTTT